MTRCAYEGYKRADAQMNARWRKALARRRYLDKSNPMPGVTTSEAGLIAAQRAWSAYRDTQCVAEGQAMRGGSLEPMIEGQCLARLTRERTAYLKRVEDE
ncbi:lysozyme inhibitor LprI family protein [Sphingomonas sp. M1A8_2b]